MDETIRVPLYRGGNRWHLGELVAYALLDLEDVALAEYRWGLHGDGYCCRTLWHADRSRETVMMHRAVLGLRRGDPLQGDHRNGDRLDNRRSNLRVVTLEQQAQNKHGYKGAKSRYRGVSPEDGRWRVDVYADGRKHYLGSFSDEDEAARVAEQARRRLLPMAVN